VKRKRLLQLVLPISLIVVMIVAIPLFSGCMGKPAAPPEAAPPEAAPPEAAPPEEVVPAAPAEALPAGLLPDEVNILGHLPDQQIGVEYPIGETINIGFLAALSGPDAGWGLPGLTGNTLFIDAVNKCGGLLVGGTRYPLKMYEFDDEAIGSKALQGARQLVLENDVKFISAIGGAPCDAVHPFLSEEGVVYASLIATDIKPDRPYLIAGGDTTPRIDMLRPLVVKMVLPREEELGRKLRWAVTSQDDPIGRQCQAWEVGCAVAEGWEVVYDKHFAIETTDFAPIATAVMATNPDAISLNLTWPDFQTLLWEQFYLQGYEGVISQNYISWEPNLTKVPPEWAEARWGFDNFPTMDDPWWGDPSWNLSFTKLWDARYGPGGPEDLHRIQTGIDYDHVVAFLPWAHWAQAWGMKNPNAGRFPTNDEILETARALDSFPTILGPGFMYGENMWGIDNMISLPITINKFDATAMNKRVWCNIRFEHWYENIIDIVIPVVEEHGQMWYQR
jgi:branched-chain amino acid transport system substrate-binding protein